MSTTEIFELGRFSLTTGFTLPNAKLAYNTHGKLNTARDNAILFPNFLGGSPEALEIWIGNGRPLDPGRYFIILPGQFGNGVSSSPSNTPSPYDRGAFPAINVADDVIAQHRLVSEHFGIEKLQLVLGWSVGALQTYEWAVRFPNMVQRVASIAGAPKPSAWTHTWLQIVLEEPIITDPNWNNGFYADAASMQGALRRQSHGQALTLPPPRLYREELWRSLGFASVADFIRGFWEAFMLPQDPNNLLCQTRKALAADPAAGGNLDEALGRITAKTFVAGFTGDVMFPPEDCARDAARIPHAQFQEIHSIGGHLSTFALFEPDRNAIDDFLRNVLAS
jgi:homoserine O-acetyltransferase